MIGLYWDNGKENGNYYIIIGYIIGLYRDNGKENENNYIIIGYITGLYWDNGQGTETILYYILHLIPGSWHPHDEPTNFDPKAPNKVAPEFLEKEAGGNCSAPNGCLGHFDVRLSA